MTDLQKRDRLSIGDLSKGLGISMSLFGTSYGLVIPLMPATLLGGLHCVVNPNSRQCLEWEEEQEEQSDDEPSRSFLAIIFGGSKAIANEDPKTVLDLCAEAKEGDSSTGIRNLNAYLSREEVAWVAENDNGTLTLAELLAVTGEPLCKADGENGIIAVQPDGTEIKAVRYIWRLEFRDNSNEYFDVLIHPATGQPMGAPGGGVVTP